MKTKLMFYTKCALAASPLIAYFIYAAFFPLRYMDNEYPLWRQQWEYVHSAASYKNDILILGDSKTKAAVIPSELSQNTYNLALGGTTPIEMYYALKNYLNNNAAPNTVIIIFSPWHYCHDDCFWWRTTYFHYLGTNEQSEILSYAKQYGCTEITHNENAYSLVSYAAWSPAFYSSAIKNNILQNRYSTNKKIYNTVAKLKGQITYGAAAYSDGLSLDTTMDSFTPSELITFYMKRLIKMCLDCNIFVVVEQTPINIPTYKDLNNKYLSAYVKYMRSIENEYPDIVVSCDIPSYSNSYFGDANHLNKEGATTYSKYLRNKYLLSNGIT